MANEIPLPPIKATEPGRNGRKHTVASVRLNSTGKVEMSLTCGRSGCDCGGWYVLEDLLEQYKNHLATQEKETISREKAA